MKKLLISLLIFHFTVLQAVPVVIVELPGLLGNRLFAYCMGKIIAEKKGWKVHCDPIYGFPTTYSCKQNLPTQEYPLDLIAVAQDIDLNPIWENKSLRNIRLRGYFQRSKYFTPYAEKIRKDWLRIDPALILPKNHKDIVVHVRALYPKSWQVPFEYYKKALDSTTYEKVYICTDDPTHPYLDNFKPYNPIIRSTRNLDQTMSTGVSWAEISKLNLDDFLFIHSFDKIIINFSTYSWWAAYLSDAKEIYAPNPTNHNTTSFFVNEERYHFIDIALGV